MPIVRVTPSQNFTVKTNVNPAQTAAVKGTTTFVGAPELEQTITLVNSNTNVAFIQAQTAFAKANAAYDFANTRYSANGGLVSGDMQISGNIVPTTDIVYNLGTPDLRWKELYLSGNTIYLGAASITTDNTTGALSIIPAATVANPNPTALIITTTGSITSAQTIAGTLDNVSGIIANTSGSPLSSQFVDDTANTGNAAFSQANAAFIVANNALANTTGTFGGDLTISGNLYVQGTQFTTNTEIINQTEVVAGVLIANGNYSSTNTNSGSIIVTGGVGISGNLFANGVYDSGVELLAFASAAFNTANAALGIANNITVIGNTISLGSNTAGLLVSNAVTLSTSTSITNAVAEMNQILGKLVPSSPPAFPSSYGSLSITGQSGPYRMTNFTQQDNTGTGTASVAGGTSVNVLRSSSYTTSTVYLINSQAGDVLTVVKDSVPSGTRTMSVGGTNAGTYGDLHIISNADYASIGAISYSNFWYFANVAATGTVANGWNNVYITDTSGTPTSNATWYYDNNSPGTPTFSSLSIVPNSVSLTYSSTIPHYNSSTNFLLGANISKLSGDTFPASNTFMTASAGGAFSAPSSNTYSAVGITYPLARNLYVSSGYATVNTTASIISGFGSSAGGPSITIDNSYTTGSQSFATTLANTVLYKTGTSSSMEETSVTIGSTIGVGSGAAYRILNPGSTDTPAYTGTETAFNSQTSSLTTSDATIVAGVLKNDKTNYSTGYLPPGPNLSSQASTQYFTFKFVRTSVSKFNIEYTGTIAGLYVALPGSLIDTSSSLNGWLDMSVAYAGSGYPGANSGGNGSNGCALGGTAVLNSSVTNGSYTCTFGTVSSSSTSTNEIYVRVKLTTGQSVTALSLQTASN